MGKKIVLVTIFISYILFSLSLLFNLTFLNKKYYQKQIDQSKIVERVYVSILSDKTLQDNFLSKLEDTKLQPYAADIYSLIGSSLYLIIPPKTSENAVNAVINRTIDYLRGEEISTASLDSSIIFNNGAAKSVIRSYLVSERGADIDIYEDDLSIIDDVLNSVLVDIRAQINESELISTLRSFQSFTVFFSETLLLLSLFVLMISVSYYYYISENTNKFWFNIFKTTMLASALGVFLMGAFFAVLNYRTINSGNLLLNRVVQYVVGDFFKINLMYFGLVTLLTFIVFLATGKFFNRDKITKSLGYLILFFFGMVVFVTVFKYFFVPKKCNGLVEICDKPVNEVVFASTHNSMSIAEYGWLWPSHDGNITAQLNYGIRGFLIDTHYFDIVESISSYFPDATDEQIQTANAFADRVGFETRDGTYLCHITCQLGSTPFIDTLTEFKIFLDDNRNEVVVLIIEDKITAEDTQLAFVESGLEKYAYTYTGGSWPTMRELIKGNKRVIVMAENQGPPPQWYLNAWDYTMDTPYSFSEPIDLLDDSSCDVNRGGYDKPFFLMNHWVERVSPSRVDAELVNEYSVIKDRALKCAEGRGKLPNFIAVNFFYNGDILEVVRDLNLSN